MDEMGLKAQKFALEGGLEEEIWKKVSRRKSFEEGLEEEQLWKKIQEEDYKAKKESQKILVSIFINNICI